VELRSFVLSKTVFLKVESSGRDFGCVGLKADVGGDRLMVMESFFERVSLISLFCV